MFERLEKGKYLDIVQDLFWPSQFFVGSYSFSGFYTGCILSHYLQPMAYSSHHCVLKFLARLTPWSSLNDMWWLAQVCVDGI